MKMQEFKSFELNSNQQRNAVGKGIPELPAEVPQEAQDALDAVEIPAVEIPEEAADYIPEEALGHIPS